MEHHYHIKVVPFLTGKKKLPGFGQRFGAALFPSFLFRLSATHAMDREEEEMLKFFTENCGGAMKGKGNAITNSNPSATVGGFSRTHIKKTHQWFLELLLGIL